MRNVKSERTFSAETVELMRSSALARHARRSEAIYQAVRDVLTQIEAHVSVENQPQAKRQPELSMTEVARRAGIHPVTFYKPKYKSLADEVKSRISALKKPVSKNSSDRTRRSNRTEEWKALYYDLLEAHRLTETDLAHAHARLEEELQENERLQKIVATAMDGRVVRLR